MKYKEICNKHINNMTKELISAGTPMPQVIAVTALVCDTVMEYWEGEKQCTK